MTYNETDPIGLWRSELTVCYETIPKPGDAWEILTSWFKIPLGKTPASIIGTDALIMEHTIPQADPAAEIIDARADEPEHAWIKLSDGLILVVEENELKAYFTPASVKAASIGEAVTLIEDSLPEHLRPPDDPRSSRIRDITRGITSSERLFMFYANGWTLEVIGQQISKLNDA